MTQITSPFRLPGVYFLPAHRIGTQQLPPLDVVAFVGFAERGPLHLPVLIEDMDSFEAIFGGDFALAKEMDSPGITSTDSLPNDISASHVTNAKGRTVYANLPQTVGAFFANGGRRCYIVRVCGKKSTETRIQLQGMTAIEPDGSTRPMDVYVSASSPGRWSSSLRLSTRLDTKELPSHKFYLNNTHQITWESSNQPRVIQSGDLLRLTMNDGEQWLFPVTSIIEKPTKFTLQAETVWRIQTPVATSLPDIFEADLTIPQSFLRVEPDNTPFSVPTLSRIERLRFDLLLINDTKKYRITIRDLAFNSPHSRFWGEAILLESSPLGRRSSVEGTFPQTSLSNALVNAEKNPSLRAAELFRKLQSLERIDISPKSVETSLLNGLLSGLLAPLENDNQLIFLPMEMSSKYSDPVAANPEDIGKDDLDRLDAGLFLDKFLVPEPHNISSAAAKSLMAAATDQYYVQNKRLYGLHSLAFIDEVALISIPDANHRGWLPVTSKEIWSTETPSINNKTPTIATATFMVCNSPPTVQALEPKWGPLTGGTEVIITGSGFISENGRSIVESVTFGGIPGQDLEVLNSTQLKCKTPVAGHTGAVDVTVTTLYGLGVLGSGFVYQWPTTEQSLPEMIAVSEYDPADTLLPLHQALINFCQARGDMVGILTLPAHFEKQHCLEWQEQFRVRLGLPRRRSNFNDLREVADLSFAAVYHPWLLTQDTTARDGLRALPPDGMVCGMIAAQEHNRQVWVAPANIPVYGALGLVPNLTEDDWADLYAAQINVIREEARDMRVMSAHTLSDERSLLQLSVRRLLIQLRKAAVERGMDYVFANNHEQTRRTINISLENLLRFMFERGAFAGATQASSYRVVTDAGVNPPQSIEQGRLVAQIQVAPSQPLEFITVLLNRTGEGSIQAFEA